jgi:hypothetical protein
MGTLVGFTEDGIPRIEVSDDQSGTVAARSCLMLNSTDIGKQVVLLRLAWTEAELVVVGVIQPTSAKLPFEIAIDDHGVTVRAEDRITLKCGDASVTLQRDGKIVIRGKHVVSHAAGVNRIRGGSVQLN